ncbi:MAG: type II toxin-antitoxin system prevent-host-death family antitoxin [Planctomycetales bacterium]|nr:type II toxin-antitoxin system prevent-host-death family antitoxin [Planctomycetales bacterium]
MSTLVFGVREFQAKLGTALRAVARGARVTVTSRGKPVAVLSRPDASDAALTDLDRYFLRLAAEGRVRLGSGKPIPAFTPPKTRIPGVAAQVLRDRR